MSQIYFWNKTLHVSDSSSVHHQEFFTVHTAMVYVIQVCWQLVSKPVCPDDGQRNCPKHVEFYSKNKFETLVHLVGFIIRIYHDARSPERQIQRLSSYLTDNIALQRIQSVYSVEENESCVLRKSHRIHERMCGLMAPGVSLHIVTTGF